MLVLLLAGAAFVVADDDIALSSGSILHHARIAKFFAGEFVIEHDGGIAHVSWAEMPAAIQAQYPFDSKRAGQEKQAAAHEGDAARDQASAAARQRALALAIESEKPPPGTHSEPGTQVLRVSGRVLQVLPDGILLRGGWQNQTLEPYGDHYGGVIESEPLFVAGAPSNLADGDEFSGVVYPAGRYAYTSVIGATKTVYRYATSAQLAAKLRDDGVR